MLSMVSRKIDANYKELNKFFITDENGAGGAGADSVLRSLRFPEGTCWKMAKGWKAVHDAPLRGSQTPQNGVCASRDNRTFDLG